MRIAVVIPAHNAAPWIDATLATVAAQTHPPEAVLVVDDGSQDDTVGRLAAWQTRLPMLQVVRHATAQGPSAARNTGWRAAETEWIAFVDADDLWHPEHLAQLASAMARTGADVVCSRRLLFESTPDAPAPPPFPVVPADPTITRLPSAARALFQSNLVPQSGVMVTRAALARIGGYDEGRRLNEDYDVWCRLAAFARFAVVEATTLAYRLHGAQASRARRLEFEASRWPVRLPLRALDRVTPDDERAWCAVEAEVAALELASAWRVRSRAMLTQVWELTASWPGAVAVRQQWGRRRWLYWPYRALQALYDALPAALRAPVAARRAQPIR